MAVEDGAVLGYLLGQTVKRSAKTGCSPSNDSIVAVLELYEQLRKSRTTVNVQGAVGNRKYFHLRDGKEQEERDATLANYDWGNGRSEWKWIDSQYRDDLLGFDTLKDAETAFEKWWEKSATTR
jgi:salicylate hydroxylase